MKTLNNKQFLFTCLLFTFLSISQVAFSQFSPGSTLYGSDIKVTSESNAFNMNSKISVAGNGWIYVLENNNIGSVSGSWHIFCSKNQGRSFSYLTGLDFNSGNGKLMDADLVVTGNDSASIVLFVAFLVSHQSSGTDPSYCLVDRIDAAGNALGGKAFVCGNNRMSFVSIATDFRSPDLVTSHPFSVVVSWTWSDLDNYNDNLSYACSSDGGTTWVDPIILYTVPSPGWLGKTSISIGNAGPAFKAAFGIAFELTDATHAGQIGVIVDFLHMEGNWLNPTIMGFDADAIINKNPVICMKQCTPAYPAENQVSVLVAYEHYSGGKYHINYGYIDYQFLNSGCDQAASSDFFMYTLNPTGTSPEKQPHIALDKGNDKYLLTWLSTNNNDLLLAAIPTLQPSVVQDYGNYRDLHSAFSTDPLPRVDINQVNGKACFSWIETDADGQNVYFDSQWADMGIPGNHVNLPCNDLIVYPNPARGKVFVDYSGKGSAVASLSTISDTDVLEFIVANGKNAFDVSNLPNGLYVIKVVGEKGVFAGKFIKQ